MELFASPPLTHLHCMYLLNPWIRVLLEKPTGSQLVMKFSAFYGTRGLIAAFTSVPILSNIDPVHVLTSHFLKIRFNIILPSRPGSSRWSSFPQISPSKPSIHLSSIRATCPAHLIRLDLITRIISGECYRSLSSSLSSLHIHEHIYLLILARDKAPVLNWTEL